MGALVSQIRAWTPAALGDAADAITQADNEFDRLVRSVEHHTDQSLEHWEGDAAAAASARTLAERLTATHIVTAIAAGADAIGRAARDIGTATASALGVVDEATIAGFTVSDPGGVQAPTMSSGALVADLLLQASLDEQAKMFEARLVPLLDTAAAVDNDCAATLRRALDALVGLAAEPSGGSLGQPVRDILDGNAFLPDTPRELADFWDTLTPSEKDALAAWDPTIGSRDGLPAVDRSHYNQNLLETLGEDSHAQLATLDAQHPDWARGENIPSSDRLRTVEDAQIYGEWARWNGERESVGAATAGYDEVRAQLDRSGVPTYLLAIDDNGRGVLALNNPDTADDIATYVPGTGTELSKLGGDMNRGMNLLDAATLESPGRDHSVIVWQGYNAPPELTDAAATTFADAGATRLDSFQDGLRASHEGVPSSNTVIGHSYGTTVIGHAMSEGNSLDVDRVVFAGSPGVGVGTAEELRFDGLDPESNSSRIFATAAAADPVTWIGSAVPEVAHGMNPVDERFHATVFESDPGTSIHIPLVGDVGFSPGSHSNYFEPSNPTLEDMAEIIVGSGVGS